MESSSSAMFASPLEPSRSQSGQRLSDINLKQGEAPNVIPSLADMCKTVIGNKIERYSPICLRELTEHEWESIVQAKYKRAGRSANDRIVIGRKPLISDEVLRKIEDKNPHLRTSKIDELIWRECVEYQFERDGFSRPKVLYQPWPKTLETVKTLGAQLMDQLKAPASADAETTSSSPSRTSAVAESSKRADKVEKIIKRLTKVPMCVALLSQSGIGKNITKFKKTAARMNNSTQAPEYFPDVWSVRDRSSSSLLEQMEELMNGWKQLASEGGVAIKQTSNVGGQQQRSTGHHKYSGQGDKTSDAQHKKDVEMAEKCVDWRTLYKELGIRFAKITSKNGARLKKEVGLGKRTMAKTNTKKVTKTTEAIRLAKQDTKLKNLKRGFQEENLRNRGIAAHAQGPTSAFGMAVAGAASSKKRKKISISAKDARSGIFGNGNARQIALTGGKTMKIPRSAIQKRGRRT